MPRKPSKKKIEEAVEETQAKAEEYARDPNRIRQLLKDAWEKAKGYEADKGPLADIWTYLTALMRLLQAYVSKEYTEVPWKSIVLVVVAILYFVTPIDMIPDFIPVAGLVDDAMVIGFVVGQIKTDLDDFIAWEANKA